MLRHHAEVRCPLLEAFEVVDELEVADCTVAPVAGWVACPGSASIPKYPANAPWRSMANCKKGEDSAGGVDGMLQVNSKSWVEELVKAAALI